ncbi:divalent-cation tolerance protein CutA [Candidatus Micrarchaeota archaeon]|nr:divalent-cation tolerance protein CutA [Candidatus Micrarchaeota archaeon]
MLLVLTSFSSKGKALRVAKILVEEKLVACASIHSCVSVYSWKGWLKEECEWELVLKSSGKNKKKLEARLKALHSFELPQIVFLNAEVGKEYAEWVEGEEK